jgi:hypothetical protein
MKISIAVAIFAIGAAALSAIGIVVTALGTIQIAQAIPQSEHGTCFGDHNSGKGASGCVGTAG